VKYIYPLNSNLAESRFGGKAAQLSKMMALNFPVPPGFAVSGEVFNEFCDITTWEPHEDLTEKLLQGNWQSFKDEIFKLIAELNWKGVMVRSSALGEDSIDNSFAGQLDSFLVLNPNYLAAKSSFNNHGNVGGLVPAPINSVENLDAASNADSFGNRVWEALLKCWNSYRNQRSQIYRKNSGAELNGMALIIHQLIEPDFAGVIFSRSHLSESKILIEWVKGHGEQLVSGEVTPWSIQISHPSNLGNWSFDEFSRLWETEIQKLSTAQSTTKENVPIQAMYHGIEQVLRIEQIYKHAVDIEFALKGNEFYLLQTRAITTPSKRSTVYWSNTNVNENYPDPMSPLLYSIARQSYYHYFKNLSVLFQVPTQRIRELESNYSNVIGTFGCKMYYNMSSIHGILSSAAFSDLLIGSFDHFVGYQDGSKAQKRSGVWKEKLGFIREFLKFNWKLEKEVTEFEILVDNYQKQANAAISYSEYRALFHGFIEIRMHRWFKASLADFNAMVFHGLLGKLCATFFGDQGVAVQNKLIQAIPNLISTEPVMDMHQIILSIRNDKKWIQKFRNQTAEVIWEDIITDQPSWCELIQEYLKKWGFRCSGELMLTTVNYLDEPVRFIELLQQYERTANIHPQKLIEEKYRESQLELKRVLKQINQHYGWNFLKAMGARFLMNFVLSNAQKGIACRERARLKQAELYHYFKVSLKNLGKSLQRQKCIENPEDVLFLTYFELIELIDSSSLVPGFNQELIAQRRDKWKEESNKVYPDDFYTELGKNSNPEDVQMTNNQNDGFSNNEEHVLTGLCACGGKLQGRIVVLESVSEVDKIQPGDILVTRQTDPGWIVVFPLISGLIVERGGMLSHGAIVSREFGIPAIVGVSRATQLLKDNDWVELNADLGRIQVINS
jgi:rifampicin phosphotransferase